MPLISKVQINRFELEQVGAQNCSTLSRLLSMFYKGKEDKSCFRIRKSLLKFRGLNRGGWFYAVTRSMIFQHPLRCEAMKMLSVTSVAKFPVISRAGQDFSIMRVTGKFSALDIGSSKKNRLAASLAKLASLTFIELSLHPLTVFLKLDGLLLPVPMVKGMRPRL
jgi:hypothetical protein